MIPAYLLAIFKWSEIASYILMGAFIVQYTFLGKWWRNAMGLTIVLETFAIMLVLTPSMLHYIFGLLVEDNLAFAWYTLVTFSFIPVIFATRIWTFESIRRQLRKVEKNGHQADLPGGDVPASSPEG